MNYKEKYKKMCDEIGVSWNKAIKAYCYQCSGYNMTEANNCDDKTCPFIILKNNKKLKNIDDSE